MSLAPKPLKRQESKHVQVSYTLTQLTSELAASYDVFLNYTNAGVSHGNSGLPLQSQVVSHNYPTIRRYLTY
jgi:hypothetical protein